MKALYDLEPALLRALAASFRDGALAGGVLASTVKTMLGASASGAAAELKGLEAQGLAPGQIGVVLDALAGALESRPPASALFDLVLSGPEVPGTPMADTAAVLLSLIGQAEEEILLVGYAVYNGKRLFEPLARRMDERPSLQVVFCLDIARQYRDTSLDHEIVARFAHEFRTKHWPGSRLPELFYDPRALETDPSHRASLHAKCVVVDRKSALVTSANFTEAAQKKNVEVGLIVRSSVTCERLVRYFEGLQETGRLRSCSLGPSQE